MMLQRALTGACRQAAAFRTAAVLPKPASAAVQRSMMMMAGGDVPSPLQGTVKSFDSKRGYGFITPTSGGPDVFVHQSEVKRDGFRFLIRGEEVQFRMEETEAGRRALDVTGPTGEDLPQRTRRDDEGMQQSGSFSPRRPRGPPGRYQEGN